MNSYGEIFKFKRPRKALIILKGFCLTVAGTEGSLAIKFDNHAIDVVFSESAIHFILADGREISAPLEWFPKLRDANESDRNNWRLIGNGIGVHWPKLDEDIAVKTLMHDH